jgi:Right handed beta helix region
MKLPASAAAVLLLLLPSVAAELKSESRENSELDDGRALKKGKGGYYTPPADFNKISKKGGAKKGHKDNKQKGAKTPTPVVRPPSAPVMTPVSRPNTPPVSRPGARPVAKPVRKPTKAPTALTCTPTVGPCVSTADQLQTVLGNAAANSVVAVCGNAKPIRTTTAVMIEKPGITLCCKGPDACVFQSAGTDTNLNAVADSVRLQELTFTDGKADLFYGGNVAIDGGGDHEVIGCEFRNGSASRLGGNLFVQTRGSITIENSNFIGGKAQESGGGLYVLNAKTLTIKGSTFSGNKSPTGTGGGLFTVLEAVTDYGQDIVFQDTKFINNSATIGGGFFVTQLGIMPTLKILNCQFQGNIGTDAAGAGASAESLNNLSLTVSGSTGQGNKAPVCPDFLTFFDTSQTPVCILASDSYPK